MQIRYCKDCRNVRPSASGEVDANSRCSAFLMEPHPVTGEPKLQFAQLARENEKLCGVSAHYFRPKIVEAA